MAAESHESSHFSAERLVVLFKICAENRDDIPVHEFVEGCTEIKKIVKSLGSAFGIAASDITEKCKVLNLRLGEINADIAAAKTKTVDPLAPTLQGLVRWEQARKCENSNTWSYVSGSRTTLRLMWFCDFISLLIGGLLENDTIELGDCARKAYSVALEPHHTWLVKQAIHTALHFLPARRDFLASLAEGSTPEELKQQLTLFLGLVSPVRESLWAFYRANNIHELP